MGKTIVINNERMGQGESELTTLLMGNFLRSLISSEIKPEFLIFYASGVKLVSEGSIYLETLTSLENLGIQILSCSTCLNFYELSDKVRVGKKSNMAEIVSVLLKSEGAITT
ncbi:MAG TPA: sulfurtransferase-like selenium metabolism protein YedF [Terriglobales bacterium]|nr:sulfurtransferase-like selenium metabolism protein YedF [Terriglobales bacterium]